MSVNIHAYTETLDDAMQWQADNRATFELASAPGNDPWPEMLPFFIEKNEALFGLLVMGVRTLYPFSFGERGFPSNASREVRAMYEDTEGAQHPSYLTREDLEGKMGELMILPDQQALAIRPHLSGLLQSLPTTHSNPKHQRLVFWFDGK